jgi:hypothetical protein
MPNKFSPRCTVCVGPVIAAVLGDVTAPVGGLASTTGAAPRGLGEVEAVGLLTLRSSTGAGTLLVQAAPATATMTNNPSLKKDDFILHTYQYKNGLRDLTNEI